MDIDILSCTMLMWSVSFIKFNPQARAEFFGPSYLALGSEPPASCYRPSAWWAPHQGAAKPLFLIGESSIHGLPFHSHSYLKYSSITISYHDISSWFLFPFFWKMWRCFKSDICWSRLIEGYETTLHTLYSLHLRNFVLQGVSLPTTRTRCPFGWWFHGSNTQTFLLVLTQVFGEPTCSMKHWKGSPWKVASPW